MVTYCIAVYKCSCERYFNKIMNGSQCRKSLYECSVIKLSKANFSSDGGTKSNTDDRFVICFCPDNGSILLRKVGVIMTRLINRVRSPTPTQGTLTLHCDIRSSNNFS